MAAKKTTKTAENSAETASAKSAVKTAAEPVYSASEFAANAAAIFGSGVSKDVVTAAFRVAGVTKATKTEAINIVKKFRNKK